MFTGADSSGTQQQIKPTKNYQTTTTQQWSLNPSAYQNIANDQVDWAALAQQWIQMKETYPPDLLSNAPPPPSFFSKDIRDYEEKGEAPMEVEKDDEHQTTATGSGLNSIAAGNNLLLNGTATAWNAPVNNNSTAWNANFTSSSAAAQWRWSGWSETAATTATNQNDASRIALLPTPTVYSIVPTGAASAINSDHWSSSSKSRFSSSDHHHHHHHHHHSSRNKEDSYKSDNEDHDDDDLMNTLDAAKRKTLPGWIREGLEKMEREKLKQEEKERERREREALLFERRKAEEEALKELEKESLIPKKSKFDSDSEDEYEATSASTSTIVKPYTRMKSVTSEQAATTASASMGKIKYNDYNQRSKSPELNYKTRDELIQELMLAVRKNLTEILLEVTNEEILAIALETCTKAKKKAPTAQAMRKTTLTSSLSGGLGLGIYDDSSDSGSDSDDEKDFGNDKNDSDIELQETIKRRKQSFEKISREIEVQITEQEEREERRREREALLKKPMEDDKINRLAGDGLSSGITASESFIDGKRNFFYDKKDGEPQLHDKNLLKYGRSRREKKPSRFSDPRDIVKNVQTHIQILTSQQKLDSHKDEIDGTKLLNIDKGYRQSLDSNSSSSEESASHQKDLARKLARQHNTNPVKYNENSDESVSSADEIKSHRSSSRRSDRSEESRSSYRKERSSRSRSRDYYKSKSSSQDYKSRHYHRKRRDDSRERNYDRKRRDRSRSHSYDSKRKHTKHDDRSKSKERSSRKRGDSKASSRHKY